MVKYLNVRNGPQGKWINEHRSTEQVSGQHEELNLPYSYRLQYMVFSLQEFATYLSLKE